MPYALSYEDAVKSYLAGVALTREGRIRLSLILNAVAALPDAFRLDPVRRVGVNAFRYDTMFLDGPGRPRALVLIVDDSSAAYGVLRIVWADLA